MASADETTYFVDRRESLLKSPLARQISANRSVVRESVSCDVEVSTGDTELHGVFSSEDHLRSLTKTERSEVSIEIQGLRETTFSTSETVVTNRVRTVYDRSLSGSTSSTDMDHKASFADTSLGTEDSVFGEAAFSDEYQRERKTSDSYYISQTYQVNTGENSSKSVTAVRSVSFKSSKDISIGDHDKVGEEPPLHFVDRLEEIIAGHSPEVVGSPKENHVRFLWYDNDHEDTESLKRIQSARKDVQQLIENTYMVSDIADVVGDNYMGPESTHPASATSRNLQLSEDYQAAYLQEMNSHLSKEETGQNPDSLECPESLGAEHLDVSYSSTEASQIIYSASDVLQMINKQSFSSNEATWGSNTSYSFGPQRFDSTSHSSTKPIDFPQEFKPIDSLAACRSSPPTLAYSPGMAIRSYALEELAEKKFRVTPDRVEAEAKTLRFDEESSGVDLDKGSSVDGVTSSMSHSISELTNIRDVSAGSYFTESITGRMYGESSGSIQGISKEEEEDESLDKLVDLESVLVGYRFHDVGIMQKSGGICNLAFDDSDENENVSVSSAEYRSSSLKAQGLASVDVSLHSPESVPESSLQLSDAQTLPSAVEDSSRSVRGAEEASTRISRDLHNLESVSLGVATEVKPAFRTENISHVAESKKTEARTDNISLTTELEQARAFCQTGEATEELSQTLVNDDQSNTLSSQWKFKHTTDQLDAPDSRLVVKDLPNVITTGEKQTTFESAQSIGFEYVANDSRENQRQVEDISSSKEAETVYSMQAGGYSSGYSTSVGERSEERLISDAFEVNNAGSVVESAALAAETKQATYSRETDRTVGIVKTGNTAFIEEQGPTVSQASTGLGDNVQSTGKADKVGRKRKADKDRNKRKNDSVAISGKVDNVANKEADSKQADNFGCTAKADSVASNRKAEKAARKRKTANVISTGKADNDGRAGNTDNIASIGLVDSATHTRQVDSTARTKQVDIATHTRQVDYDRSKQQVDYTTSTKQVDNAATTKQVDNTTSTKQVDNAASIKQVDHTTSTKHVDNAATTKQVDNAATTKQVDNTTSTKHVDNAASTKQVDNAATTKQVDKTASTKQVDNAATTKQVDKTTSTKQVDNAASTKQADYTTSTKQAENATHTRQIEYTTSTRHADSTSCTTQVDNALFVMKNNNATNFKETENVSGVSFVGNATTDILKGPFSSSTNNSSFTSEQIYTTSTSNTETSTRTVEGVTAVHTKDGTGYHSSLIESNRRSEILSLIKNEASSTSETEHIERVIQALGPAELEMVQEEFRVTGISTTLREYLRQDRVDGSSVRKVESFLVKGSTSGTTSAKEASINKGIVAKTITSESCVSVTRRFNINSKFEASLKTMGATLKSESLSIAVYFDTADFDLTLTDCWLRSVNSEWQFHGNFTKLLNQHTKSQYVELDDKSSILRALASVLKLQPPRDEVPIAMFIQKSGLREFVRYTTIRRTYTLKGMRVDLEMPEYGFWVGSVTMEGSGVVPLSDAVRNIDSFWRTTGVKALDLLAA